MKRACLIVFIICAMALSGSLIALGGSVRAEEVIKYSCSAQIYEALEKARIDAFTKKTGIKVDVHVCSSASAVNLVMRDFTDVAATGRRLYPRHKEYGYWETIFSRDPLAVIVNVQNPLTNVTDEELREIFTGEIGNWKELGGPDKPIMVIVPGKNSAAYKNFSRNPMHRELIAYDLMAYKSTTVVEVVSRFPWSISFIAQGAARQEGIKALKIDGMDPMDSNYPYCQMFSFVTKGKPSGAVKEFIDHIKSKEGKEIMKKRGVMPSLEECE
ncbi:MAG: substrate-binding domain-containing protein [Desulfobacteraceae bacterium]|nr:MAG: substrate-binding domain-containing protein [Desulfobacteraceae bacterium]